MADATSAAYKNRPTTDAPYTLPTKAEELYTHLEKHRNQVYYTAIDMAAITIPSVVPPLGYRVGMNIDESNQSFNAQCVNSLASKLTFMALPPDRPVIKFEPIAHKLGPAIAQNPALWTTIQIGLNALEQEHRTRFEATNMRAAYVGFIKMLLVAGNSLWEHLKLDFPVYHGMQHYVVKRNNQGEQLLVILKRCIPLMDLDEDIRDIVREKSPEKFPKDARNEYEESVDIYAVCKRVTDGKGDHYWEYWEEYEGELITDTEYDSDFATPPLYAAWMIPVYGQNWGRSYCEEYQGDLLKVDSLEKADSDGAAMASLILLFLKAGARTSQKQIKKAQNMSLMTGDATDLTAFRLDKMEDFKFVSESLERVTQRLGKAFLMVSSIQRDAERVTAEEWKEMAQEIDQSTGGMYSELSQSVQRHIIQRAVALHNEEDKTLPKLPPGIFKVGVITGIEAMGRTVEGQNLMRAVQGVAQLEGGAGMAYIDPLEFVRRVMVSENVKQDGLVLTEQAFQQKKQQATQDAAKQTLLEKGTGPAVAGMAKTAPGIQQAVQAEQNDPTQPPPGGQPALPPSTGQA